jgi:hypothetical protein
MDNSYRIYDEAGGSDGSSQRRIYGPLHFSSFAFLRVLLIPYVPILCRSTSLGSRYRFVWFVADFRTPISITLCHRSPTFSFPYVASLAKRRFSLVLFFF